MKILLMGDIALNGLISSQPLLVEKRFDPLSRQIKEDYYSFANWEVPIKAGLERNEHKELVYHCDSEVSRKFLKLMNMTCLSLANNHIYDIKMPGLK